MLLNGTDGFESSHDAFIAVPIGPSFRLDHAAYSQKMVVTLQCQVKQICHPGIYLTTLSIEMTKWT